MAASHSTPPPVSRAVHRTCWRSTCSCRVAPTGGPEGRLSAVHLHGPVPKLPGPNISRCFAALLVKVCFQVQDPLPPSQKLATCRTVFSGSACSASRSTLCSFSSCRKAADFAEPSDLGDARMGSSPVRWHIDQSWTAHKSRGGTVVVSAWPLTLTGGFGCVLHPANSR